MADDELHEGSPKFVAFRLWTFEVLQSLQSKTITPSDSNKRGNESTFSTSNQKKQNWTNPVDSIFKTKASTLKFRALDSSNDWSPISQKAIAAFEIIIALENATHKINDCQRMLKMFEKFEAKKYHLKGDWKSCYFQLESFMLKLSTWTFQERKLSECSTSRRRHNADS